MRGLTPLPSGEEKCVYNGRVGIGRTTKENVRASFRVSFESNFFSTLERITTADGFRFRRAGQPVTEYPDTLTVVIENLVIDSAIRTAPHLYPLKVMVKWLDGSHRVIDSKSGELHRQIDCAERARHEQAWSELPPPIPWYLAEVTGIKQPLATEVEVVVTGNDNTPLGNARGGLLRFQPACCVEPGNPPPVSTNQKAPESLHRQDCVTIFPPQEKCAYSESVAIGFAASSADSKSVETSPGFSVTFNSMSFRGIERVRTAQGFEFRGGGRRFTDYPDTITVVVHGVISSELKPYHVEVRWLDSTHRVIESKSQELREVVVPLEQSETSYPWPEMSQLAWLHEHVWYEATLSGIKQSVANDVEVVITGSGGKVPVSTVQGRLFYPVLPPTSEPAYVPPKTSEAEIQLLAELPLNDMKVNQMFLQQRDDKVYLYLYQPVEDVYALVDVTKPEKPILVNRSAVKGTWATFGMERPLTNVPGGPEYPPEPSSAKAAVAQLPTGTINFWDTTNPKNPKMVETFNGVTSMYSDTARKLVYLVNGDGLWIVRHRNARPWTVVDKLIG
jgi:hypothetical protein